MFCFIRPGKVTCAGLVAIFMVLPNSIWKGPDARVPMVVKKRSASVEKSLNSDRLAVSPVKTR
jgi:hypothetical protein